MPLVINYVKYDFTAFTLKRNRKIVHLDALFALGNQAKVSLKLAKRNGKQKAKTRAKPYPSPNNKEAQINREKNENGGFKEV